MELAQCIKWSKPAVRECTSQAPCGEGWKEREMWPNLLYHWNWPLEVSLEAHLFWLDAQPSFLPGSHVGWADLVLHSHSSLPLCSELQSGCLCWQSANIMAMFFSGTIRGTLKAQCRLRPFQTRLSSHLPGVWKGKVLNSLWRYVFAPGSFSLVAFQAEGSTCCLEEREREVGNCGELYMATFKMVLLLELCKTGMMLFLLAQFLLQYE